MALEKKERIKKLPKNVDIIRTEQSDKLKPSGGRGNGGALTRGRPPGTPSKTSKVVKEAILEAFDILGGVDWLVALAQKDPKTYVTLLNKLLPSNVGSETEEGANAPLSIKITYDDVTVSEIKKINDTVDAGIIHDTLVPLDELKILDEHTDGIAI